MIVYDSPLQPDRNCKPFLACLPYKYISGDLLMSLSIFQMPQSCFQVAYKVSFLVTLMYLLQLLQLIFTTSKYQVLVLLDKKLVGRDEGIVKEFLIN